METRAKTYPNRRNATTWTTEQAREHAIAREARKRARREAQAARGARLTAAKTRKAEIAALRSAWYAAGYSSVTLDLVTRQYDEKGWRASDVPSLAAEQAEQARQREVQAAQARREEQARLDQERREPAERERQAAIERHQAAHDPETCLAPACKAERLARLLAAHKGSSSPLAGPILRREASVGRMLPRWTW